MRGWSNFRGFPREGLECRSARCGFFRAIRKNPQLTFGRREYSRIQRLFRDATRWRGPCSAFGESYCDSCRLLYDARAHHRHRRERDAHLPSALRSRSRGRRWCMPTHAVNSAGFDNRSRRLPGSRSAGDRHAARRARSTRVAWDRARRRLERSNDEDVRTRVRFGRFSPSCR